MKQYFRILTLFKLGKLFLKKHTWQHICFRQIARTFCNFFYRRQSTQLTTRPWSSTFRFRPWLKAPSRSTNSSSVWPFTSANEMLTSGMRKLDWYVYLSVLFLLLSLSLSHSLSLSLSLFLSFYVSSHFTNTNCFLSLSLSLSKKVCLLLYLSIYFLYFLYLCVSFSLSLSIFLSLSLHHSLSLFPSLNFINHVSPGHIFLLYIFSYFV